MRLNHENYTHEVKYTKMLPMKFNMLTVLKRFYKSISQCLKHVVVTLVDYNIHKYKAFMYLTLSLDEILL